MVGKLLITSRSRGSKFARADALGESLSSCMEDREEAPPSPLNPRGDSSRHATSQPGFPLPVCSTVSCCVLPLPVSKWAPLQSMKWGGQRTHDFLFPIYARLEGERIKERFFYVFVRVNILIRNFFADDFRLTMLYHSIFFLSKDITYFSILKPFFSHYFFLEICLFFLFLGNRRVFIPRPSCPPPRCC